MKKLILILITCLTIMSCNENYKTQEFNLRQMKTFSQQTQRTNAGFFVFSNVQSNETTMKVLANVDGLYRFIDIPLSNVRINIVDSTKQPSIQVAYWYDREINNNHYLTTVKLYYPDYYILNVSEKYIPEELTEINITK